MQSAGAADTAATTPATRPHKLSICHSLFLGYDDMLLNINGKERNRMERNENVC
jgi:hypothetical protein